MFELREIFQDNEINEVKLKIRVFLVCIDKWTSRWGNKLLFHPNSLPFLIEKFGEVQVELQKFVSSGVKVVIENGKNEEYLIFVNTTNSFINMWIDFFESGQDKWILFKRKVFSYKKYIELYNYSINLENIF